MLHQADPLITLAPTLAHQPLTRRPRSSSIPRRPTIHTPLPLTTVHPRRFRKIHNHLTRHKRHLRSSSEPALHSRPTIPTEIHRALTAQFILAAIMLITLFGPGSACRIILRAGGVHHHDDGLGRGVLAARGGRGAAELGGLVEAPAAAALASAAWDVHVADAHACLGAAVAAEEAAGAECAAAAGVLECDCDLDAGAYASSCAVCGYRIRRVHQGGRVGTVGGRGRAGHCGSGL